jgi:perosamine synthetase
VTLSVDPEAFLSALAEVIGQPTRLVALHEPRFAGHEWDYVKDCLDSGWVSSVGQYVERFETELAAYCGVKHCVAVVNGTAALHVALLVAGVRPGDEVLVPALSFVATANAVSFCGAFPHFVDSSEHTLGLDPNALAAHLEENAERLPNEAYPRNNKTGRRISAVVPMHTFGHPVDMQRLNEVAEGWGLTVIEDAAESLGSTYRGRPAGSLARLAALSFNGNKIMTTGGGGAILTDDDELARLAKHLSTTAKKTHSWRFEHDMVAFNYRMPNINAALGCAQLEQVPAFLAAKRRLAKRYSDAFSSVDGLRFFTEPEGSESNYWLNTVILDNGAAHLRDELLAATNSNNLATRPVWTLLHRLQMYESCPRSELPIAEKLEKTIINIPSSAALVLQEEDLHAA